MDFFAEIFNTPFIVNAIIAAMLSAVACGITGTFITIKKTTYLAGGIAHSVMAGLGIAYFYNFNPVTGAMIFAVVAAFAITLIKSKFSENEDTVISALWSVGMATGIIFTYLAPGYKVNLLSYLFGNILLISSSDLYLLAAVDLIIFLLVVVFYRQLVFVSFDEDYSGIRGINVQFINLLLNIITALTVVVMVQSVGIILVIALMTLPSSIAKTFHKKVFRIIVTSTVLITLFSFAGLYFSFQLDLPSGATIIIITGTGYMLNLFYQKFARLKTI